MRVIWWAVLALSLCLFSLCGTQTEMLLRVAMAERMKHSKAQKCTILQLHCISWLEKSVPLLSSVFAIFLLWRMTIVEKHLEKKKTKKLYYPSMHDLVLKLAGLETSHNFGNDIDVQGLLSWMNNMYHISWDLWPKATGKLTEVHICVCMCGTAGSSVPSEGAADAQIKLLTCFHR